MITETLPQTYTVQEFLNLEWPNDDENAYELIKGRLFEVKKNPGPSNKHAEIVTEIARALRNFAGKGEKALGITYSGVSCEFPDSYIVPDVAFVVAGRIASNYLGPLKVIPDLVVEVNSPSDDLQRIHDKLEIYRTAGVSLIWSVYLLEKFVVVYRRGQSRPDFLSAGDDLNGGNLLPGFTLPVDSLFE